MDRWRVCPLSSHLIRGTIPDGPHEEDFFPASCTYKTYTLGARQPTNQLLYVVRILLLEKDHQHQSSHAPPSTISPQHCKASGSTDESNLLTNRWDLLLAKTVSRSPAPRLQMSRLNFPWHGSDGPFHTVNLLQKKRLYLINSPACMHGYKPRTQVLFQPIYDVSRPVILF